MKKSLFILLAVALVITPLVGDFGLTFAGLIGVALLFPKIEANTLYMAIPIQDAQGLFTKKMIAVYKEKVSVTGFLRSFFPSVESMTSEVSIAVQRGTERVAVDVTRYSDGNRNQMTKSTEKIIKPPIYHEYLTANEHRLYNQTILALSLSDTTFFSQLTAELADELMELQKKIERAIELQCKQVLEDGIVQLNSTTNIDYKRKAGSLVAYSSGNDFSIDTVDPRTVLAAGCKFIREKGKAQAGTYNAILGETALTALLNNAKFKTSADLKNVDLGQISPAQRLSEAATLHGEISVGSYKVRLWTYPEVYEDSNGNQQPYINPKKVIILPLVPKFNLVYGAVPQLIKNGTIPQKGAYLIQEFLDEKRASHEVHIKSAPIAIPVAVDQIYTIQVIS